jgi:hypothetical protein
MLLAWQIVSHQVFEGDWEWGHGDFVASSFWCVCAILNAIFRRSTLFCELHWQLFQENLGVFHGSLKWNPWQVLSFSPRGQNKCFPTNTYILDNNNGEYNSHWFSTYCTNDGIKRQFITPYTPQHNGVAERCNCSLLDITQCFFLGQRLFQFSWGEVVRTLKDKFFVIMNTCNYKPYNCISLATIDLIT